MRARRTAVRFTVLSALLVAPALASAAPPGAPLRFTVLSGGNPAGRLETRTDSDGARISHFEYNDRGRGPSIDESIRLDPRGVPSRIEITGHDYFGNKVDERFSIESGKASWKNSAERGTAEVRAASAYLGIDATLDELAILARALLSAPGRTLHLLPAGDAGITELSRLELTSAGKSVEVVQYAVSGLGFAPQPIWLEAGGGVFFQGTSYLAIVREGWESEVDRILAAQMESATKRLGDAAKRVRRVPAGALVLRDGALFDPATGRLTPHTTVVISGRRITAVG
ncbi:MAG TPA: hypothetical protein VE404_01460, partial [Verrucomicrobiae bacterium]|nr:hypothetical protein [Verrucomicrobiae bacterium]